MRKPPECSVIIPTYNRVELLRHTLDSLVAQRLPRERFEVLVVDDGSSDGTTEMVGAYHDRLSLRYFFQPDEGWRTAKARNVGIAHAAADICVLVDSGVLLDSGALGAHIASHEGDPAPLAVIGYVYGFNIDNEDADAIAGEIDLGDPGSTIARMTRTRTHLDIREEFYEKYTDDFHALPAPWSIFWTCNVSARTSQLRGIGGFDEAFTCWGGEDLELGYRLHRDGAKFVLNRQAAAIHYPHHKSFEENERGAQKNYRYMVRKHETPIVRLLLELPDVDPFNINDVISERGLPSCADYLSSRRLAA